MRTIRVLVVGVLLAGGLAVLAPNAVASAPAASKACQSLKSLNQKLEKALASDRTGKVDTGAVSDVASSFKKPPKGVPANVKSAMSTIASVASNVGHSGSTAGALAALRRAGAKLTGAVVTWGAYVTKTCPA
jgi:hypothetical protein